MQWIHTLMFLCIDRSGHPVAMALLVFPCDNKQVSFILTVINSKDLAQEFPTHFYNTTIFCLTTSLKLLDTSAPSSFLSTVVKLQFTFALSSFKDKSLELIASSPLTAGSICDPFMLGRVLLEQLVQNNRPSLYIPHSTLLLKQWFLRSIQQSLSLKGSSVKPQ